LPLSLVSFAVLAIAAEGQPFPGPARVGLRLQGTVGEYLLGAMAALPADTTLAIGAIAARTFVEPVP